MRKEPMKILVTGSRDWTNRPLLERTLATYWAGWPDLTIIEGCARGADQMAEDWAVRHRVPVKHHPAKWDLYGKSAGPRRNEEMLREKPDLVVAFHENLDQSRGTAHMVRIALARGVDVSVIDR